MMAHTHKTIKCLCGEIVSQCRCPDLNKITELVETCPKCEAKRLVVDSETPAQQKARIINALQEKIRRLSDASGNQALGLATFAWLVEAEIRNENLEKQLRKARRGALVQ